MKSALRRDIYSMFTLLCFKHNFIQRRRWQ